MPNTLSLSELRHKIEQGKAIVLMVDIQDLSLGYIHNAKNFIEDTHKLLQEIEGKIQCLHIANTTTKQKSRLYKILPLSVERWVARCSVGFNCLNPIGKMPLISRFAYKIPRHHRAFLKVRNNAFADGALEEILKELGIDTVILTGMHAKHCVLETANGARNASMNVVFASDLIRDQDYNCSSDDDQRLDIHRQIYNGLGLVIMKRELSGILSEIPRSPVSRMASTRGILVSQNRPQA